MILIAWLFSFLALLPFPFDWDQADTLPVEKSLMLPKLSPTPAMMILISAMTLVSLSLNLSPLIACKLKLKELFCPNFFFFAILQMPNIYAFLFFRAAPVTLPSSAMSIPEGASFVVSGWGTTSEGGSLPSTLRYDRICYTI